MENTFRLTSGAPDFSDLYGPMVTSEADKCSQDDKKGNIYVDFGDFIRL